MSRLRRPARIRLFENSYDEDIGANRKHAKFAKGDVEKDTGRGHKE